MIILILASQIFASTLFFGNKPYEFKVSKQGMVISQCQQEKCQALRSPKLTRRNLDGGKNPATQACGEGEVVLFIDQDKNQHAVCRFSDGSMVTADSIYAFLKKK